MIAPVPEADPLRDLETRQDELLAELDRLNERLERALAEFNVPRKDGQSEAA